MELFHEPDKGGMVREGAKIDLLPFQPRSVLLLTLSTLPLALGCRVLNSHRSAQVVFKDQPEAGFAATQFFQGIVDFRQGKCLDDRLDAVPGREIHHG